jgi:alpha-mannosidase
VSTVKMSEDGKAVVARVYNPTEKAVSVRVKPAFKFRKAARTDFLEKAKEGLKAGRSGVRVRLGKKQVATVRFEVSAAARVRR